jgi:di/tricarboxylate transporter
MLWGSPRFGQARQDLYLVSVSSDESTALQELDEYEEIMVVAAQTTKSLHKAEARPGELCLVSAASAEVLIDNPLVGLWQKVAGKAPQTGKTTAALLILLGVILSSSFGLAPVELIATAGATLMVVTKVLTPQSAARALNWNILAIIAGSIGLGTIVMKSGLGDIIATWITRLSGGEAVLVALVFAVVTTVVTNVVTNAAAAAILTPVAVTVANDAGLNPAILLILIGTCISLTFLNPIAHQTNLMVMGPGGYTTRTFVKFGIPVTLVTLAVGIGMGTLLLK